MATIFIPLEPVEADYLASAFPQVVRNGTNFPVSGLAFDAVADEAAFFRVDVSKYGSGNLTLELDWYADTAISGDVVWEAALAAITPGADTQDVETKTLATAQTVTASHLGTTGQRLHKAILAISNLDSLAAGDFVALRIRRLGSNIADTMTGDAILAHAVVSYSDT